MVERKDDMNINVLYGSIAVCLCAGSVYLLTKAPDYVYNHEIDRVRQYVLEEKRADQDNNKSVDERRKIALTDLHTCLNNAETSYSANWSRACLHFNKQKINECIAANITESTCKSKFVYDEGCDLPSIRSSSVEAFRESSKAECQSIFHLQMGMDK